MVDIIMYVLNARTNSGVHGLELMCTLSMFMSVFDCRYVNIVIDYVVINLCLDQYFQLCIIFLKLYVRSCMTLLDRFSIQQNGVNSSYLCCFYIIPVF